MLNRRSMLQASLAAAATATFLSSCRGGTSASGNVRLFLNWLFTASFAGDVLAARDFAGQAGISLDLQVGGEGRDPIRLVGKGDIGVASADEIIRAIEIGVPIKIIGVLNDTHPAAFVSLANSGVTTPKAFEGKRVGMLPFGATGLVYQALTQAAQVDRAKITEVVVTPDLRPFISGQVNDVQPIFMYDETITLEEQGVKYNLIDPREYGVNFKGQCYFATIETIEEAPDLLIAALRALVQGWELAARSPAEAITALKERSPTLDSVSEERRLIRALPFFVPDDRQKILRTDPATWSGMIASMVSSEVLKQPIAAANVLQMDLLDQAYAEING